MFVVALTLIVSPIRDSLLRILGHAIITPVPTLKASDILVLSVDVDGAGALTAADLIQRGVVSRVAVFADPPDAVDREFLRRGVPYYNAAAVSIRELNQLGVENVEVISRPVTGSEDEGKLLPDWCDHNRFTFVVLVVSPDHGRRMQRIVRRAMSGHHATVIVYPASYSNFDPHAWWKTRNGARNGISEFEKLVLDLVRHPAA